MTPSEAVAACEFWTTNSAETVAIGSTASKDVGEALHGLRFDPERLSDPGKREGWSITVGRWIASGEEDAPPLENPLYLEIATEIERRAANKTPDRTPSENG